MRCNCPHYNIPSADPYDSKGCPVHDPDYKPPVTDDILLEIYDERRRQDEKWVYPQIRTKSQWTSIILEELGEVSQLVNDLELAERAGRTDHREATLAALNEELVQTGACIVAFIKHLREGVTA